MSPVGHCRYCGGLTVRRAGVCSAHAALTAREEIPDPYAELREPPRRTAANAEASRLEDLSPTRERSS